MNELIKQRINQLNNGEIPSGYEKTEFGIFPCDWVKDKTFGDLFDFYGGLGKSREELGEEGYAYLHYGDLHRGSFNVVSHAQYEHLPKYDVTLKGSEAYLMEDGDVAFLDASEDLEGTSRSVLIDNPDNEPFIAGLHVIFGKSKNNSLEKWYKQYITATDSVRKQFQRLASGFKVYGVTRETLPKIQIAYPKSADEQSKIAEILMKWDEAIELYNQQVEKLKQLKSIWLKKMFPKKGERVPEWRFKGFTDAWEQRKAIDIADYSKGNGYSKGDLTDAGTPIILYGRLYTKYQFAISEVDTFAVPRNGAVYSQGNEVIVPASGETAEDIARASAVEKSGVMLGGDLNILRPFDFISPLFLALAISNGEPQKELAKKAQGKSVVHIHNTDIQEVTIAYPSRTEQDRIVSVFRQLDNLITLHQCKVEKIKAQQKVLQKYLLNGIVRV